MRLGSQRLPSVDKDGYELVSGEEMNRLYPETFSIPPLSQRSTMRPGRSVKLIFQFEVPDSDGTLGEATERMWVTVVGRVGEMYVGELDNDPRCTQTVKSGARFNFLAEHIIDVFGGRPQ